MNGEMYGYLMERLLDAGALDVYYTPIIMKKNRPAIKVSVICNENLEEKLTHILLRETTTLGVRKIKMEREILERKIIKIHTAYGEISVKISGQEHERKIAPEFEDCRKIALAAGIPIRDIYQDAIARVKELEE